MWVVFTIVLVISLVIIAYIYTLIAVRSSSRRREQHANRPAVSYRDWISSRLGPMYVSDETIVTSVLQVIAEEVELMPTQLDPMDKLEELGIAGSLFDDDPAIERIWRAINHHFAIRSRKAWVTVKDVIDDVIIELRSTR